MAGYDPNTNPHAKPGDRPCHDNAVASSQPGTYILRFDHAEAEEAAGHPLPSRSDSARFAADLIKRDVAGIIIIGRQAEGSVLVTANSAWFCNAAAVPVVSTTGAGDSLISALVWALAKGESPSEALRRGVAAASATVTAQATRLCDPETISTLRNQCHVKPLGH